MPPRNKRPLDASAGTSNNRAYYELVKDYLERNESLSYSGANGHKRYKSDKNTEASTFEKTNKRETLEKNKPFDKKNKKDTVDNQKSLKINNSTTRNQHRPTSILTKGIEPLDSDSSESDSDEFNDEDFEDVEIRPVLQPPTVAPYNDNDTIAVTIRAKPKAKKARSQVISKEQRLRRKEIHMMHLVLMIQYGKRLNSMLSNHQLQLLYSNIAPKTIYQELHPSIKNKPMSNSIKSRYFLDGLRHLMEFWIKKFNLMSSGGIFKLTWDEIESAELQKEIRKYVGKHSLKLIPHQLSEFAGNRDVAVQGYVALLRSMQVRTRLIYSIQPPDFTNASPVKKEDTGDIDDDNDGEKDNKPAKKKRLSKRSNLSRIPKFASSQASSKSLLQRIITTHNKSVNVHDLNNYHLEKILKRNPYLSAYPVFWAEAWNPYVKRWITVDPVNFRIIEDIQRVSKLEPPMTDERNALLYAIAFDKRNRIKDVTRRYASSYNSKTRKKRITRDNKGYKWYGHVLKSLSMGNNDTDIDALEDEYFAQRNVKEGMPSSIGDFKNHPIYVIESQLRSNEILYPREPCGYVQQKTNEKHPVSIPIYYRDNVQELKSARGWFHKGRVVKVGQRALRVKQKQLKNSHSAYKLKTLDEFKEKDEDEDNVRLYAEFQTEPFTPEPVVDGKVPKNAYGNIDVYTDNMIPKGGVLITSKFCTQAAKLLDIDYSPAVTGFNFGYRSSTKPKISGVVVAEEFAEAVNLVNDHLEEQDIEMQRIQTASKAVKAWKMVFAKLRIVERLDRQHGEVPDEKESIDISSDEAPIEETYVDTEVYGGGGFLPTDLDQEALKENDRLKREERRKTYKKDEENEEYEVNEKYDVIEEYVNYEDNKKKEEIEEIEEVEGKNDIRGSPEEFYHESYGNHDDFGEQFEGGGFFTDNIEVNEKEVVFKETGKKDDFDNEESSGKSFIQQDDEVFDDSYVYNPYEEEGFEKGKEKVYDVENDNGFLENDKLLDDTGSKKMSNDNLIYIDNLAANTGSIKKKNNQSSPGGIESLDGNPEELIVSDDDNNQQSLTKVDEDDLDTFDFMYSDSE